MSKNTYIIRGLRQIVMVEGWQAVYWNEKHLVAPLHALGLGACYTRRYGSKELLKLFPSNTLEEDWEIFGLEYSLSDGWLIAQDLVNFCGLLPPGATLADWEEDGACESTHPYREDDHAQVEHQT